MKTLLVTLTASAFIVTAAIGLAQAQQSSDEETMQQGEPGQTMMQGRQRGERMMQQNMQERMGPGSKQRGRYSAMMRDGKGHGMRDMGHRAMMQIMFAVVDADGDDALSLEEVQEVHARIFRHIDASGDGKVTKAEIRAFFRGGRGGRDDDDDDDRSDDSDD